MTSHQSTFALSFNNIEKEYAKKNLIVRLDLSDGKHSKS